jgi:DNA-binding transcriptional regulator YhcF (GntR family)
VARFDGGWVKIRRKALLGDINSSYTRGGLFCALVAMANLKQSKVSWRGKPRELKRGEIVTSFTELAELGDVDRKTVKKHLEYLQSRETIDLETSTQGILIRLVNFGKHQDKNSPGILDNDMDSAMADGMDNDMDSAMADGMDDAMDIGMVNGVPHIEEYNNIRIKEVVATIPEDQKELLENITNKIFELTGDTSLVRYSAKILGRFKASEEFSLFLEEVIQSSMKVNSKPGRRTYLKTAFLREIGVIREPAAS